MPAPFELDGSFVDPPELAIPIERAHASIFDAAIWRRYQEARKAIRQAGGFPSLGVRLGDWQPSPRLREADNWRTEALADAERDAWERVDDGRLEVLGRRDTREAPYRRISPHILHHFRLISNVRRRTMTGVAIFSYHHFPRNNSGQWSDGTLRYFDLVFIDAVGVTRELAGRIYGPSDLIRHIQALEVEPEVVEAEYRRTLAELEAWVDAQLQSGRLVRATPGEGGPLLIRPPPISAPAVLDANDLGRRAASKLQPQELGPPAAAGQVDQPPQALPMPATDENVRGWFQARVRDWPKNQPFPNGEVDRAAFELIFGAATS